MGKKRVALVGEATKAVAKPVVEVEVLSAPKTTKKTSQAPKPARKRGRHYSEAYQKVVRTRSYQLPEAIKLLKSISITKFNGSVDAHLVVSETGLRGEVKFPHPTGKTLTVRIADDKLVAELEKGKVNFSVLLATSAMMPKLLKFAKILGPKGLMPNPKTGTLTDEPEKAAQALANKTLLRTETKFPLIHVVIGKVNDPEENLAANFKALMAAVGKKNIQKIVLAPTMGPGIKVDFGTPKSIDEERKKGERTPLMPLLEK